MFFRHLTVSHAAVHKLERLCPRCGKRQVVPARQDAQTVRCSRCGAEVPPARASGK